MIMRRATELLGTTAFLTTLLVFGGPLNGKSTAAGDQYASRRIDLAAARPARRVNQRGSMIAGAATGQGLAQAPPKPLDGSLLQEDIRRVGFLNEHGEPGCGCGEVICDCGEVSCGVEPLCGVPVGCECGLDAACVCGVEPGCGIDVIEPVCEYVEPACGCVQPDCGCSQPMCDPDCGCDVCVASSCDSGCPFFCPT